MNHPIDRIEWRDAAGLRANHWNPNRVHKPELRLLERSILATGWIQPIHVNTTGLIIDGFHRWRLTTESKKVGALTDGQVPCAVLDLTDDEAMAVTVRINRAKGAHVAVHMHDLVTDLVVNYGWSRERVAEEIGANVREVDLLLQEGIFAARDIKSHAYSKAWYPMETGTRTKDEYEAGLADEAS